jgi:hypothetical protein
MAGWGRRQIGDGGSGARCRATGDAEKSEGGEQGAASAAWRGEGGGAFHRAREAVGRRPAAVEFYSSSVSKELKGEEEKR